MKYTMIKTIASLCTTNILDAMSKTDKREETLFKELSNVQPKDDYIAKIAEYVILLAHHNDGTTTGQLLTPGNNTHVGTTILDYNITDTTLPGLPKKVTFKVKFNDMETTSSYQFTTYHNSEVIYGEYYCTGGKTFAIEASIYEYEM